MRLSTLALAAVVACVAQPKVAAESTAVISSAPLGSIVAPVWQVGDEWQYSYRGPADSGTFVWSVNRIEALDGVPHYVIKSGTREIFYRVSDLAVSLERVGGVVVTRETPSRLAYVWPLSVGRTWEQNNVRETPVDRQTIIRDSLYTVEAEETITVSAGTFRTLKIVWRNKKTNGLFYEMWYAPDVKLWVKIREVLSNGIRERELIGFKVNQTQSATPTAEPDVIGPSAASASPSAKPVIRRGITKVSGNDPAFPRAAIRAGIERGHVVSRVQVDETGNVDGVTIIKADPPDHFDQAVIEALKEWKFQGDGNRWVGEIEINFELKDSVAQEVTKSRGQPIPPLPAKLTGAILSQTTQFVPLSDGLELQISSQDVDGKVAGLFSRAVRYQNPGQQCMRADNMHSDGIYDGKKLVLTVRYSQGVSICNDVTLTFYRGKEHYFHTLSKDGSWSMYLDPVK